MRHFKHLSLDDRLKIEKMRKEGANQAEIARALRVSPSTISRELRRGRYMHINSDLTQDERYSPDIADANYRRHLSEKGADLKIGKDHKFAAYIEKKIADEKYSPAAVLGEIKAEGIEFETKISVTTLYHYIDKGVFLRVTNKNLPRQGKKKNPYKKVRAARPARGESIEKRPKEIEDRQTVGHWEMDCVEGPKKSKKTLLVLTERKTRWEILVLMKSKTMKCVVEALDEMEQKCGKFFPQIFKSITVDNGSEFSDYQGMEMSKLHEGEKRTKLFYCHPYSSWERGSNENQNGMVRREFPKGFNFENTTKENVKKHQVWMNHYPRGIFEFLSADKLFQKEFGELAALLD